jgi:hypothetical protein
MNKLDKLDWQNAAYSAVIRWGKTQRGLRTIMTMEQIRGHVELDDEPDDLRWWGDVTRWLIRDGHIRPTAGMKPARSSHGNLKRTYFVGRHDG